ncbi:MAG TPA: SdrD B-like domain-containing protein, partial [Solirubrobacteraceae bacterium]|nr:SdrD B-like domain-containing protein [Solirubrobacteraceae bacterium]
YGAVIALVIALAAPSAAMAEPWANEQAMRDSTYAPGRDTFVYDPGVGQEISREDFVHTPLFSYYKGVGFDANFLTWARVQKLNLGSSEWSGCAAGPHSGPCSTGSLDWGTVSAAVKEGPITVLYWKGAFIATVCGNFTKGGSVGPIPQITGVKYEDLNANGKRDPGEPGLSGWTIKLRYEGKEVASTKTGANGSYAFDLDADHLPIGAGVYEVEEVQKPGWFASQEPGAVKVPLGAQETTYSGRDFGNYRPAKIAGHKFDDSNVNGVWDPLEGGLAKWGISLSNKEQRVTDPEGAFSFSVRPGTYTVSEQLQEGWRQTDPGGGGARTYTVVSGEEVENADFGNVCLGGVSIEPVDDSTGKPVPVEVRLEEVEVPGILSNEPSLPRTLSGTPSFDDLLPGTYRIVAFLPKGVFTTDPDAVPVEGRFAIVKEVTVDECESTDVPIHLFTTSTPGKVTGGIKIDLTAGEFATSGFEFMTREAVPSGTLQYNDHATGLDLHTAAIEAIDVEGEVAFIWGKVPVGESLERFRLRLVDAGEPGIDDHFELTLADGYATGEGETLSGGNVQIHES